MNIVKRMMVLALGVAASFSCAGIQYRYVSTGTSPAEPKPASCEFAVLAAMPSDGPYTELGVVEPLGRRPTDQIDEFKQLIRGSVCQAGGDAVVGEINRGCYVRGIVLRRVVAAK